MLHVNEVTKKFGELTAVDHLSFSVSPGEIFGLLGTNGAGKTTTFRMIMGLLAPTQGSVMWNNSAITYKDTDHIGFLIEERSLIQKMTVKQQIIHFGRLKNLSEEVIVSRLDAWLDFFEISEYKDKKIKELSKGNQQKIQFIAAIINEPKLLVLDEPFSGLDPLNIEKFIEVIRLFQKKGSIIIFSTHRIDHVELFCEQLIVLQKGKAIISGNIDQIKDDFKRKTVWIKGDVSESALSEIDGVMKVRAHLKEFEISVRDEAVASQLFDYVKTCSHIERFSVEKPSLSEIFIEKVGESYHG